MRKALFCVFLAVGCKSNPSNPPPTQSDVVGPVLETATVNWGEAPGVIDLATPRLPVIAEEVKAMRGMDALCFEELWTQESKDAVIEALGPDMHTYYEDTRGENQRDGVDVCSPSQAKEAISCARSKCGKFPAEKQTICVVNECDMKLLGILVSGGGDCLNCLTASVGNSIEQIVNDCVQPENGTRIAGISRAYNGQNGVLLASRWPLKNREVLRLRASFSNRVALFATIEPDEYGPIEIACAHISTETKIPPNHPDFSNWDEEMIAQIEAISVRLQERAGNRPSLFLGDMNAGPAIAGKISGTMPKVWQRIGELGFYSPAAYANPPFCSICEGNTLRSYDQAHPAKGNNLIDHVLLRDPVGDVDLVPVSTRPFVNQRKQFKGYGEDLVDENLSDHYGVIVNFRMRKNK